MSYRSTMVTLAAAVGVSIASPTAVRGFGLMPQGSGMKRECVTSHQPSLSNAPSSVIELTDDGPPDLIRDIYDAISDPENYEEGEAMIEDEIVRQLGEMVNEAGANFGQLPRADIAPYFGELSITWRLGQRVVRLTAYPNSLPSRIDYGSTSPGTRGDYDFDRPASGPILAERLRWLYS